MNTNYVVVGVVALVIGAVFAGAGWLYIAPYQADASNAERVEAVVISSSIVEGTNAEGQATYAPSVTYRYAYDGTNYTSSSIFPGDVDPVTDRDRAQEIADEHRPGESVTAYVNTDDPARAFLLDQPAPWWYWLGPVVGLLSILYGLKAIRDGLRGVEHDGGFE